MSTLIRTLLLLTLAIPALASDGVLEIAQTCAVQTGCFPGDTAGFPVTIDGIAGKSYRLTSDLAVPDGNTDGIRVSSDNVSVDLAGFEISGPVVCSGSPTTCAPDAGEGSGVVVTSADVSGLSIRNGSIRGMGSYGAFVGLQAEVKSLRVRWNRLGGIFASSAATISGNTAYQNGQNGFFANVSSTVSGNTATLNGGNGIEVRNGSTISGNTAYRNALDGIDAFIGSTVIGNSAYLNGSDGISANSGCLVRDNTLRSNGGFGLRFLGSGGAYGANVVTNNGAGTVSGGNNLLLNFCDGPNSPQCP